MNNPHSKLHDFPNSSSTSKPPDSAAHALEHLCCHAFDVSPESHGQLPMMWSGGHGCYRQRRWVLPVTAGQAAVGTRALVT